MYKKFFKKALELFVFSANRINEKKRFEQCSDMVILDKRYFNYNEETHEYSVTDNGIELLLNANVCVIGDNPGKNEADNKEYFYYEKDDEKRDERTAGSKIHKAFESTKDIVYFNKSLIYTDSTKNLKQEQIECSAPLVISFLFILCAFNKKIKLIFMGVDKRFKNLYKRLTIPSSRTFLMYHPCSSKYSGDTLKKIASLEGAKESLDFKKYGFVIRECDHFFDDICKAGDKEMVFNFHIDDDDDGLASMGVPV